MQQIEAQPQTVPQYDAAPQQTTTTDGSRRRLTAVVSGRRQATTNASDRRRLTETDDSRCRTTTNPDHRRRLTTTSGTMTFLVYDSHRNLCIYRSCSSLGFKPQLTEFRKENKRIITNKYQYSWPYKNTPWITDLNLDLWHYTWKTTHRITDDKNKRCL